MQFLKTVFSAIVAAVAALFCWVNWTPVTVNLWSDIQADIKLPILLLIGGVETTTNLLGITLVELKRHPEVYARVRADPELIAPLIEEVLRYNPPVQIIFRHTMADTELSGVAKARRNI